MFGAFARNDLAVVRVDFVKQLRIDARVAEIEGNLGLLDANAHVAVVAQRALEFADDLGGQDDVALRLFRQVVDSMLREGQAAAIRRDHGDLTILEAHENALQRLARVVLGGGIGRLAEHLAQRHLRQHVFEGILVGRKSREIHNRQAADLEEGRAGGDVRMVAVVHVDFHRTFRGLGNGVDEQFHRQGRRPFGLDFAPDNGENGNVEVGRRQRQLLVLRFELDILDDLHRPLGTNDVLDLLESFEELGPDYSELHHNSFWLPALRHLKAMRRV